MQCKSGQVAACTATSPVRQPNPREKELDIEKTGTSGDPFTMEEADLEDGGNS